MCSHGIVPPTAETMEIVDARSVVNAFFDEVGTVFGTGTVETVPASFKAAKEKGLRASCHPDYAGCMALGRAFPGVTDKLLAEPKPLLDVLDSRGRSTNGIDDFKPGADQRLIIKYPNRHMDRLPHAHELRSALEEDEDEYVPRCYGHYDTLGSQYTILTNYGPSKMKVAVDEPVGMKVYELVPGASLAASDDLFRYTHQVWTQRGVDCTRWRVIVGRPGQLIHYKEGLKP